MSKYINLACHTHPLTLREGTGSTFKCALCHCHGYGSWYSCFQCSSYRIHDSCAECPHSMISFFGHPQHPLALQPEIPGGSGLCCALCRYCIHGIHYGCRACGLFLHPVCATLPPSAISPAHPQHFVTLIPDARNGKCTGCSTGLDVWHYVCAPCGVRLHPWCLLGDGDKDGKSPLCIRGAPAG